MQGPSAAVIQGLGKGRMGTIMGLLGTDIQNAADSPSSTISLALTRAGAKFNPLHTSV